MNLSCQQDVLNELKLLAYSKEHSVLISGPIGCGKTYIAEQYAELLGLHNIYKVDPSVKSVRSAIVDSTDINHDVLFCVENLDLGTKSASYSILKFLEEPSKYIYIVVTCRNRYHIPDTILSRSICLDLNQPSYDDMQEYMKTKYKDVNLTVMDHRIKNMITSFSDCDIVCSLSYENIDYITSAMDTPFSKKGISDSVWSISHYPEGIQGDEKILPYLVVKCMLYNTESLKLKQLCIDCLDALDDKRIASNIVLSKFVMELKYTE